MSLLRLPFRLFHGLIGVFLLSTLGSAEADGRRATQSLTKQQINLVHFAALTGWSGGRAMNEAARLLALRINSDPDLLPNFEVVLKPVDTRCSSSHSADALAKILFSGKEIVYNYSSVFEWTTAEENLGSFGASTYVGFIGCSCSGSTREIIGLSGKARKPLISPGARQPDLSDRTTYPYFWRTVNSMATEVISYASITKLLGLKRMFAVFQKVSVALMAPFFQGVLNANTTLVGPELRDQSSVDGLGLVAKGVFVDDETATSIGEIYLRQPARMVFLVGLNSAPARTVACGLYNAGVRGTIFVNSGTYPNIWQISNEDLAEEGNDCTYEAMLTMFQGTLLIGSKRVTVNDGVSLAQAPCYKTEPLAFYNEFVVNITDTEGKYVGIRPGITQIGDVAKGATWGAPTADALCVYALVLHELLEVRRIPLSSLLEMDATTFMEFQELIGQVDFQGMTGRVKYSYQNDPLMLPGPDSSMTQYMKQTQSVSAVVQQDGNVAFHGETPELATLESSNNALRFTFDPAAIMVFAWDGTVLSLSNLSLNGTVAEIPQCPFGSAFSYSLKKCKTCRLGTSYDSVTRSCRNCHAGFHGVMLDGQPKCRICEAGRFANVPGLAECLPTTPGHFSLAAQTEQAQCLAGMYSDKNGTAQCDRCPKGKFQTAEAQTACDDCVSGRPAAFATDSVGTTTSLDCGCAEDSFLPCLHTVGIDELECKVEYVRQQIVNGTFAGACAQCPEGLDCRGFFMSSNRIHFETVGSPELYHAQPIVKPGFYTTADAPYSTFRCRSKEGCIGGIPGQTCSADREGISCVLCKPGMYHRVGDGSCSECDGNQTFHMLFGVTLMICVLVLVYWLAMKKPNFGSPKPQHLILFIMSQLLTGAQTLHVISSMVPDWPSPYSELKAGVQKAIHFVLDFESSFSFECLTDTAKKDKFLFHQIGFVAPVALLLCIHLVFSTCSWRRRCLNDKNLRVIIRAIGSWGMLCLIPMLYSLVAPLRCEVHPNGKETLHAYPFVLCWDSDSVQNAWLLMDACCTLVAMGFVAAICYAIVHFPRHFLHAHAEESDIPSKPLGFIKSWTKIASSGSDLTAPTSVRDLQKCDRNTTSREFLHATNFLFFRVRPQKHWFVFIILLHNALITLSPCIPSEIGQAMLTFVGLLFHACFTLYHLPWPIFHANFIDVGINMGLLLILFSIAMSVEDPDQHLLARFSFVVFAICVFFCAIVILVGLYQVVVKYRQERISIFRYEARRMVEAGAVTHDDIWSNQPSNEEIISSLSVLQKHSIFGCVSTRTMNKIIEEEERIQSEEGGISVAYLLSDSFEELAESKAKKTDPSFYDLKGPFWKVEDALGKDMICPRDGLPGVALTDYLPRRYRRKCTHFLSWTWAYHISMMRDALTLWLRQTGMTSDTTFLFCCFFCNNQFRILRDKGGQGSENLEDIFEARLLSIGRVVALLDTWQSPLYLSRVWTIFEQYSATKLNLPITIILPENGSTSLVETLSKGNQGFKLVTGALSSIDSERSKASNVNDEEKVKNMIRTSIGFKGVNQSVARSMIAWVGRVTQDHFRHVLDDRMMEDTEEMAAMKPMSRESPLSGDSSKDIHISMETKSKAALVDTPQCVPMHDAQDSNQLVQDSRKVQEAVDVPGERQHNNVPETTFDEVLPDSRAAGRKAKLLSL